MSAHAARARVLIVDDEPGMLRAAERVLGASHEVMACPLPSGALAACAGFGPDLLVTDIRMPEMDGFVLAEEVRRLVPGVDVIFMTGSQTEPDAHLVRAVRAGAFYFIEKPFDRAVLETLVDRCLELRRLRHAERAHARRLGQELGEARVFQRTMLAPGRGKLAGWSVAGACRPCSELGGDLYDYTLAEDGALSLIVADVRGHGVSAGMLTATVKAAFRTGGGSSHAPLSVVNALSGMLAPFGEDRFVTAFCARLWRDGSRIEYVNAGHPAALVGPPGEEPAALGSTGPIVGAAFPLDSWELGILALPPDSRLVVYTDGLSDVLKSVGDGLDALIRAPGRAQELLASLLGAADRALGGRPAPDDVSVLVAGRSG